MSPTQAKNPCYKNSTYITCVLCERVSREKLQPSRSAWEFSTIICLATRKKMLNKMHFWFDPTGWFLPRGAFAKWEGFLCFLVGSSRHKNWFLGSCEVCVGSGRGGGSLYKAPSCPEGFQSMWGVAHLTSTFSLFWLSAVSLLGGQPSFLFSFIHSTALFILLLCALQVFLLPHFSRELGATALSCLHLFNRLLGSAFLLPFSWVLII